jgi:hypothetical protein
MTDGLSETKRGDGLRKATCRHRTDDDLIAEADIVIQQTPIGRAIHRFLLEEMHRASRPGYSPVAPSRLLSQVLPGLYSFGRQARSRAIWCGPAGSTAASRSQRRPHTARLSGHLRGCA